MAYSVYDGADAHPSARGLGCKALTRKTILFVGAVGRFAGVAVTALIRRVVRVTGIVPDGDQGNHAHRLRATEVVVGDLLDLEIVEATLTAVTLSFPRERA